MESCGEIVRELIEVFERGRSFIVTSHVNPDGDAVGSMGALYYVLTSLGKEVLLYNKTGVPSRFEWLPFAPLVRTSLEGGEYSGIIFLDCGDRERVGGGLEGVDSPLIINIDHHPTNTFFGDINWVDPSMSSVGEMVAHLARACEIAMRGEIAEAIYTAIISDTGGFTFSNTSAATLSIVSQILEQGFDLDEFNRKYQRSWSLNRVHLHGLAMQRAHLVYEGQVGVITIPYALLERTATTSEDCEGIINYVRQIKGVKVAVVLREEQGGIKFSLRSWGEVDVSKIASSLGGGGHKNAAGGVLSLSLEEATSYLLDVVKENL